MAFAHLHVHSEYSDLDGMIRIGDAFTTAQRLGQDAIAITDHGTLAGLWQARKHARNTGVKLIPGCEVYLANGSRFSQTPFLVPSEDDSAGENTSRGDEGDGVTRMIEEDAGYKARPYQHLTVLAATPEGWRNLVLLNNKAQESRWHKPRIDLALLKEHADGLIVLTGCLGGPVLGPLSHGWLEDRVVESTEGDEQARHNFLANKHRAQAYENLEALIDAVGAENVYVEVMDHGIEQESAILEQAVQMAEHYGLKTVATNDAHHTHEDGHDAHAAWLCVQSKSALSNPKFAFHGDGFWLKSEAEMRAVRPESWWQEACSNTQLVADRIGADVIPGHRDLLPKFPTPEGFASNRDYVYSLLRDGALHRYGGITPTVRDRVMTEMEVIEESHYVDYFLVVHELISWCRQNGILVGPGRGSAGGSMVAYLLGITQVDPIRYSLLFERFLERGRLEPPDIDIDFPQSRRDDVIEHLRQKWGEGYVANIGTFGTARSKAAIKDAARVLEVSALGEKMSNLVPMVEAKPMQMDDLLNEHDASTAAYRQLLDREQGRGGSASAREVHDLACAFEDMIKTPGVHASGVIVSAAPLRDLVPMRRTREGAWALQWTGPEAEEVGLLKVDVLGLRNLDIVDKAVQYIRETTGEDIDPDAIPDPDQPSEADRARVNNAWRVIAEGRTEGLFQLESPAMTELAVDVAPRSLNDLSALVALFRPGPMGKGLHTEYAARKRGTSAVTYRDYTADPAEQQQIATVLGETHGLMTYQEQVMMLGTVVAGFSPAQRSKLRKAVSKKKKDVMEEVGRQFTEGGTTEQRDEQGSVISIAFRKTTVDALWDAMVSFAEYAFNRSHSATYGYLAYVTAYLKGNWPVEFAAATLAVTSTAAKDKRLHVLRSLRREGITVLPPDLNVGAADTAPAGDGTIRIGLGEVRGLRELGEKIVAARQELGEFTSVAELYERVQKPERDGGGLTGSAVTSAHVQALIECGALDEWCGGNRLGMLSIASAAKVHGGLKVPAIEWSTLERANRQRTALGLTVGEHPMVTLADQIAQFTTSAAAPDPGRFDSGASTLVVPLDEIPDKDGESITTVALLAGWTERAYSKGRRASVLLESPTVSISATMWNRELEEHVQANAVPAVGQIVTATGRIRYRSIAADPTDENSVEQTIKELVLTRVRAVPIREARRDVWGFSDSTAIPDLTGSPDGDGIRDIEPDVPSEPDLVERALAQDPPPAQPDVPDNVIPFGEKLRARDEESAPEWDVVMVMGVPSTWGGISLAAARRVSMESQLEDEVGLSASAAERLVDLVEICRPKGVKVFTAKATSRSGSVVYLTFGASVPQVLELSAHA